MAALFGMLFLLQSCTYAISSATANKVDKNITFEMLQLDPDSYKGSLVIFGGTIKETTYLQHGMLIDVFQKPLDWWGRPIPTQRSGGRFLIYSPAILGPDSYAPGREITVAGEVAGTSLKGTGNMGDAELTEYDYPVLIEKELQLWPNTKNPQLPDSWDSLANPFASPRQGY